MRSAAAVALACLFVILATSTPQAVLGSDISCSADACCSECGEGCCDGCSCADHCSTSHCEYKMKKFYRPVVSFKKVCYTKHHYCTECQKVPAPTTTCCPPHGMGNKVDCGCSESLQPKGLGSRICGWFGKPRDICVPVAVQTKGETCTRCVPVVTWVVEYRCVKVEHEEKHHH